MFDSEYYQDQYPDIKEGGIDPLLHFVRFGWREGRNPNRHFSTEYYLKTNPDIAASGINPFVHFCRWGKAEKREAMPYYVVGKEDFQPLVSVIVPNYNHAQYLPERFRSILSQTYTNIELIVLDDKSKDNSIEVINEELKDASIPVQTCFNETNSGNVFAQWQRGVEMANGDLVWICESDDTCEPDFLEKAVPHFVDRAVMLTFGGIQFCNSAGEHMPGMDGFRENSESGIWSEVVKRPAKQWFDGAFGINNVVANVGGCVFRRMPISAGVWQEATTYKIAGDWFLYSHIIGGGKMVYEPDARTYFRQHEKNTSASNFDKLYYYEELWRLLKHHIRQWGISASAREKFIENMAAQYRHFEMEPKHGPFEEVFDTESIMTQTRERKHIVLAFLGFHSGGGEVFPINMANKLLERGHFVSMLAYNMADINQSMIERLDRRVPVLHFGDIRLHGRDQFFASIGASVVHSHVVHCDVGLLRDTPPPSPVPYVVSLHGSHDTLGSDENSMLFGFLQGVNHWVYTADKNLKMFKGIPLDPAAVSKVRNAMPRDTEPFPQTREDLGIDPDAVVYTLVARGIQQKGWRAAIAAFRQMQEERPDIHAHLILIGDGDKADEATAGIKDHENISNLGFQSQINGIYQLTDCAVVPTRFDGESFPLCIIQALQEGTPVIATDIGEIKNMINDGAVQAGILLENNRNSEEFFGDLFQAMVEMADQEKRAAWAENASALGKLFDMDDMVDTYERIYDAAGERHRSLHPEFYDEEAA